jgi:hypothetical protein
MLLLVVATGILIVVAAIVRSRNHATGTIAAHRDKYFFVGRRAHRTSRIGWIVGAVCAPCFGVALALNHQLDTSAAVLTFGLMPFGCVGTYFLMRWVAKR